MNRLLLALILARTAFAQSTLLSQPRPNASGSSILFLSSLRLAGTDQPLHGKIFEADATGVQLVESIPRPQPGSPPAPYQIIALHSSSDAGIIAYTSRPECTASLPCLVPVPDRSIIRTRDGQTMWEGTGTIRLSSNGRYALLIQPAGIYRLSLPSAGRTLIASAFPYQAAIGDAGQVLLQYKSTEFHYITTAWRTVASSGTAILSGDGDTVAFQQSGGGSILHMPSGREWPLPGIPRAINHDGTRVLHESDSLSPPRDAWIYDTEQESSCVLFTGIVSFNREYALSANGNAAFLATNSGIRRMECASAAPSIVVQPPVSVGSDLGYAVPGSLGRISFSNVILPAGQPPSLGGFRVTYGGESLPLVELRSSSTSEIVWLSFQFPWELRPPGSPIVVTVDTPYSSPFAHPGSVASPPAVTFPVLTFAPSFLLDDSGAFAIGFHQDLRPLTREDPARTGEVVHLLATGLGPVDRNVETGKPSPGDPPAKPFTSMNCDGEVETVLAPGLIGVYRVTVRVPTFTGGSAVYIRCGTTGTAIPHAGVTP